MSDFYSPCYYNDIVIFLVFNKEYSAKIQNHDNYLNIICLHAASKKKKTVIAFFNIFKNKMKQEISVKHELISQSAR